MGRDTAIDTPTGSIGAWRAEPVEAPRGALVVVQEIFGVNAHIRSVVDRYAAEGLVALAPAFFDPLQRGVELAYDQAGMQRGRALVDELGFDRAQDIVAAAAARLQAEGLGVGVVGFCWGGSIALLANLRLGLPAVSYYGARNTQFTDQPLRAPMQFHFGECDASIPAAAVDAHRRAWPDAGVFTYPGAGHAFNRDVDPQVYDAPGARQAHTRTMNFFARTLA